jgi:hypothetical protein
VYHVSKLDSDGQQNGRRGLAKLFLDAFWWWGYYIPFPFCEELLADWAEMANTRQSRADRVTDHDWGDRLRDLYVRFPKGWRAKATREDWDAIRDQLAFFARQREISEAAPDNRYMRHVRAMLHLFLGIAERNRDPRREAVEQHFREARALFAADEDEMWNLPWVSFQEADAALGRGDAEGAVAAADTGWHDLTETGDDDFELAANFHRVHADAAWARGERDLALDLYARATLSAYKFQVDVGDSDIAPVDEYTQAFMTEMHERAAERLAAMHEAGEDRAVRAACARIRQFFDPYWSAVGVHGTPGPAEAAALLAAGRAGEVIGGLFPPPPAPADLHLVGTPYALTATEVLYDMEDELAQPPGTPLPPVAD